MSHKRIVWICCEWDASFWEVTPAVSSCVFLRASFIPCQRCCWDWRRETWHEKDIHGDLVVEWEVSAASMGHISLPHGTWAQEEQILFMSRSPALKSISWSGAFVTGDVLMCELRLHVFTTVQDFDLKHHHLAWFNYVHTSPVGSHVTNKFLHL